jgi:Icc protein
MLRFIHITDTHLGATPHFTLYGKQPLQYLQRLINRINDLPFDVDFVLHTGDCIDDARAESYPLFRDEMAKCRFPVKYVVGNHDHVAHLQTIVMGEKSPKERLDYTFEQSGIQFVVLDTRGPLDPGGQVEPQQIEWLRRHCTPEGPPMLIAMHHVPVKLDTPWLDTVPPGWGRKHMFITNADEVLQALRPARQRIKGVFCGHVHGLYQTVVDGILFTAGQSSFAPVIAFPNSDRVCNDEEQSPMFNIVTVTPEQILIRPRCFRLAD